MNENNFNNMIEKWKKIYKEKADQLQKRSDRKRRIKNNKRPVVKKKDDNKYDKL